MLSWIRTTIERNRARALVENARAWYTTCREITRVMADALHDQSIAADDIGYVIDQVDRMLFRLGFYFTDSMGTLRRHNPDLAKRFDKVNQQVYVVRNEMTVFLIRSQGPGHMSGDQLNEEIRMIYYYQALGEVGFNARVLKADLDRKLNIIWKDLQKIISQEEKAVDFQ
jgi:hypothetical protein